MSKIRSYLHNKQLVYQKEYDEIVTDYTACDKQIRKNIIDMVYSGSVPDYLKENQYYHLLGFEQIYRAYRDYESGKQAIIPTPANIGELRYTPSGIEATNDKCMVFDEQDNIVDYVHLNSDEKPEWDNTDYYRARHYSEDCRYIRINNVTYDLFNPQEIMSIPFDGRKNDRLADQFPSNAFMKMIGYDSLDARLYLINQCEESKLNQYWSDDVLDAFIELVIEKGVEYAAEQYNALAINYCNENGIILNINDIKSNVRMKANCIQEYMVEHEPLDDLFTPEWIRIRVDKNYHVDEEAARISDEIANKLNEFWTEKTIYESMELAQYEGIDVAKKHYIEQLRNYCSENGIEADDRYIEKCVYEEFRITEDLIDDVYEESSNIDCIITVGNTQTTYLKNGKRYTETIDDGTIKHWDNELLDFLSYRTKYCVEPELIVPLAYITVNLAFGQGAYLHNGERIVAQLIALGVDEYGEYLDKRLSELSYTWKEEEAIPYGRQLKDWAANEREYKWVKNNLSDLAPKTKGAYTTGKRSRSKKYLAIKDAARAMGYELNDNL